MLHADVLVLQLLRFFLGIEEYLLKSSGGVHAFGAAGNLGQLIQLGLDGADDLGRIYLHKRQQLGNQAILLHHQRHVKMLTVDLLVPLLDGYVLAVDDRPLCVLCVIFLCSSSHLQSDYISIIYIALLYFPSMALF